MKKGCDPMLDGEWDRRLGWGMPDLSSPFARRIGGGRRAKTNGGRGRGQPSILLTIEQARRGRVGQSRRFDREARVLP